MNTKNAQQSNLYRSTKLYFCVSLIIIVSALCTLGRPLLWLFWSPKHVCTCEDRLLALCVLRWDWICDTCLCLPSSVLRLCMESYHTYIARPSGKNTCYYDATAMHKSNSHMMYSQPALCHICRGVWPTRQLLTVPNTMPTVNTATATDKITEIIY